MLNCFEVARRGLHHLHPILLCFLPSSQSEHSGCEVRKSFQVLGILFEDFRVPLEGFLIVAQAIGNAPS